MRSNFYRCYMTSAAGEEAEATTRASELPIAEVAELTGLSKDTLRYYERAGLIEAVGRSSGGQRRYASSDLDWLRFLLRLRATGMPIAAMRQFAELRRAGSAGVAGRIAWLSEHRDDVRQQIADLKGHLDALDTKLDHYHRLLDEQPEGAPQ